MKWLGRVTVTALVVAVAGGVGWVWARSGTGEVLTRTTTWAGVVGAVGLLVAAGTSVVQGIAGYRRWLAARPDVAGQLRFATKGRPPLAGGIDVTRLGAKPPIGTGQTPYVARDVDGRVDELIAAGGMVVLSGPAAAGKSRLAAEAVHRAGARSKYRLLVPVKAGSLRALAEAGYGFGDAIIVLDDLEHFLCDGGLDTALLDVVCALPSTVVVATIRADVLADLEHALGADLADRTSLSFYRPGVDLLRSLRREDRIIAVASDLSEAEETRAEAVSDGRISDAVASSAGFGEHLIAGPAQMRRWTNDTGDALGAVGRAVITAAVDARRAGFDDRLPAHVLDLLTPAYLPRGLRDRGNIPAMAAGRAWAAEIITGTTASSCVIHHHDDTYSAADYLTDRADQPPSPLRERAVPDSTWAILQSHATPAQATDIGYAAYQRHRPDIALTATAHAAEQGDTVAMYNLGFLLKERGDLNEAETWWRRGAEQGATNAMNHLGALLEEGGKPTEAEDWYRRAIAAGDTDAMVNLGVLLKKRGDLAEAEESWRRAIAAGHTVAVFNLGNLLVERGDPAGAEDSWRRAAAAGHISAMVNLGALLKQRGDLAEAEDWYRRAIAAGHTRARNNLAILLEQRGDLAED